MNRSLSGYRIALLVLFMGINSALADGIDSVRFVGIPPEWMDSIKTAASVLVGEDWDSKREARAIQNILEYTEARGYPSAKVMVDLGEASGRKGYRPLSFRIQLGAPIRILSVAFVPVEGSLTDEQNRGLIVSVAFREGEPLDRERVKEMRRAAESALAGLKYVDSRVLKIETESIEEGIRLKFKIELGQRVAFSTQGSEFFSRSELMKLIEEQRLIGLGRDYVSVLQNRIRDHYVAHGFRRVKVVPYTFEPRGQDTRRVVFDIQEGVRARIKNLTFDGNDVFSSEELEAIFFKGASDRIRAKIYNEKMAESAAQAMIEELKRRGYLSAKLIAFKSEEIDATLDLSLYFFISEGLQTRVRKIQFSGNKNLTDDELQKNLGVLPEAPLSLVQLEDGLDRMKQAYRNLGFLEVKVANESSEDIVTYYQKNQLADLKFEIEEGLQFRLKDIKILGNEKTAPEVILREIKIGLGEDLAENRISESEEGLRRLGIFSEVKVELEPSAESKVEKVMKITVKEGVPGNAGFGIGYRNDLGLRFFGDLTYGNLWGKNHSWVFNASANRRLERYKFVEYQGQMSYIWPWAFLGETTFRPSLNIERRQYIQFSAETFGFSAGLDRVIYRRWGLRGTLTYNIEQVRQFEATRAVDNQQIRIGSITPTLRLDLRDNPLIPRRGFYLLTSYEYADPLLGAQAEPYPVKYGRYQLRTDWYVDLKPDFIWYASVRGGWVGSFSSEDRPAGVPAIPLIRQFALGGVNSLRGYIQDEINIQNNVIQNFSTFTNYRTQFDYFVSQNLSIGPFLDAGNLNIDSFSLGDLKFGAGLGLRFITPVGPVNFDWGFKLRPRGNEQPNVFYFSLGVI